MNWEEYWSTNRMTWESTIGHDTITDTKNGKSYEVTGSYFKDRTTMLDLCMIINQLEKDKQDLIQLVGDASKTAVDMLVGKQLNEKVFGDD